MSNFETTELKLQSTPTGGVSGEHSPYYRRLLSAGYKGFIQGTIGGAGFYGFLGLAVGALLAVPAAIFMPALGFGVLALIPAAGAVGVIKGANTFGNIGTVAAISAESADLAEQRRVLLDRYYDLPDGPEGDKQAAFIANELKKTQVTQRDHPVFHWKTVAICAALGGLLALGFITMGGPLLAHSALGVALEGLEHVVGASFFAPATAAIGATFGALAGGTIGIDRYYVRKWFDGSEKMLHEESHSREAADARVQQLEQLREAAKLDNQTKLILERRRELGGYRDVNTDQSMQSVASLDAAPSTKINSATLQNRLADIQKAMEIPTV